MVVDPFLYRVTCNTSNSHGDQTCRYVYRHFPSHSRATFDVRKRDGKMSVMNGWSSTPKRKACARVSISNNYAYKTHPEYRDYEMHELHRKVGCPPSDFGVMLWGMVDVWRKMEMKGTIGAHVTDGGATFGQRTQSKFLPTDDHTIIEYNLDGIQEYAQNRLTIRNKDFHERHYQDQ